MDLKQAFIESFGEIVSTFGLKTEFEREENRKSLDSAEQVNLLVGFTKGIKGNAVISLSKELTTRIISSMMCGMQIDDIDEMGISAISELVNMITGTAIQKLKTDKIIELSPPSVAIGEDMFILISRVSTVNLKFKIDERLLSLSFCIE
jgi:chemotaxis protein CheX